MVSYGLESCEVPTLMMLLEFWKMTATQGEAEAFSAIAAGTLQNVKDSRHLS